MIAGPQSAYANIVIQNASMKFYLLKYKVKIKVFVGIRLTLNITNSILVILSKQKDTFVLKAFIEPRLIKNINEEELRSFEGGSKGEGKVIMQN